MRRRRRSAKARRFNTSSIRTYGSRRFTHKAHSMSESDGSHMLGHELSNSTLNLSRVAAHCATMPQAACMHARTQARARMTDDERRDVRFAGVADWITAGPRSCDGPRGSVSMRHLGLAGQRSLQARRALVSLASIVEWPVNNRCVSAPHDNMRRRRRESHGGWRGLARSGRVVGPREGDGSLIDARLVALASITWVALAIANGQARE